MDSFVSTETASWSLYVASVTAILIVSVKVWLERRLTTQPPFPGLPTLSRRPHWLLGHLSISRKPLPVSFLEVLNAADDKGRVSMWLLHSPLVIVHDAVDARKILLAEHHRKTNFVIEKHFSQIFGTYNILLLNDRLWKNERAVVHKALATSRAIQTAQPVVQKVVRTLVQSLKQRIQESESKSYETQDTENLMKMVALDVFVLFCFSHDLASCASLDNSPVATAFNFLGAEFSRRVRNNPALPSHYFYWWPNLHNRQYKAAKQALLQFLHERLAERQAAPLQQQQQDDMLGALLKSHQKMDTEGIAKDTLLGDVLLTLLFAGYDTTSISLTYTLYLMSQDKRAEQHCLEEIASVGLDDPERLVYCRAVVQEALRLYPPAFVALRHLKKPVTLSDGLVLPANVDISLPIWAIHRAERNFARSTEFLPERWVSWHTSDKVWRRRRYPDDNNNNKSWDEHFPAANPDAFLAFAAGARDCPGQKFAWQEAILVLAHLLQSFTFQAPADYVLQPGRNGVVQHPEGGLPLTIRLRK